MKPENAIEFTVHSDLSEAALEYALDTIIKRLKVPAKTCYGCLMVPSQLIGEAILLVRHSSYIHIKYPDLHLAIDVSSEYAPDEFSVQFQEWDWSGDEPESTIHVVWSPGA